MKRRFFTGMFVAAVLTTAMLLGSMKWSKVQASESKENYSIAAELTDPNGFYELSIGDIPEACGQMEMNGKIMDSKDWEWGSFEQVKEEIGEFHCFYSRCDNEKEAEQDRKAFEGQIPADAFGKYIYRWFGAYPVSQPDKITYSLIRSKDPVTAWADSDYYTVGLNKGRRSVFIYSIYNCESVSFAEKVTINSKDYKVTAIGDYALEDKESIVSLRIPASITAIGNEAFYNAKNLKYITIEGNITHIGERAFMGIHPKAEVTIKAKKIDYKKNIILLRNSGIPKTVKFKRI